MELMQASFDDAFPDIPLPNLGSGISRIHVVTFSLFNSFNAASHDLSNSQCKFWDQGISSHPQSLLSSQEWAAKPAPKAVSHMLRAGVFKASCRATRTLGLLMLP